MHPMAIDRRQFTAGALAILATPTTCAAGQRAIERTIVAATTRNRDGSYAAALYDLDKGLLNAVNLPARGHDVAINPVTRECVAFARRPGTFAIAFNATGNQPPIVFHAPSGRHFYGHGIFSPDGRLLYTTENDHANGAGVIGVWDVAAQYKRVGELSAHGIGPHDINLLSDGRTIVVANGGILTHPDHGRQPLNLATMSPSLTYIDRATGELLEQQHLPTEMAKRSIRHLDVGANDTVVFGCQYKGPRWHTVDLVGFHRRGQEISLLPGDPAVHRALRYYVSSVAVDRSGKFCAITSSRGQHAVVIDIARQKVLATHAFADISGIAAAPKAGGFVASSGNGKLAVADGRQLSDTTETAPWSWDNHAITLFI
jgi:uncharacterized protein